MTNQMTIEQAANIVLGTKPTSHNELTQARAVMSQAAQQGWKFGRDNLRGSAANPCIVVVAPVSQ
jgi:hypothetical protein